jgi:hypothetical protein
MGRSREAFSVIALAGACALFGCSQFNEEPTSEIPDAGDGGDAAGDAGASDARPTTLSCGSAVCNLAKGEICCASTIALLNFVCSPGPTCPNGRAELKCTAPSDCAPDKVCCLQHAGANCADAPFVSGECTSRTNCAVCGDGGVNRIGCKDAVDGYCPRACKLNVMLRINLCE